MTLTIDLSPEKEAAVHAAAQAEAMTAEQWLQRTLENGLQRALQQNQPDDSNQPLSSKLRALWSDMPEDVRQQYPEGGARQVDHHVYGLPKR
jgi:hypothetical protein